jgi:hypothetical protein
LIKEADPQLLTIPLIAIGAALMLIGAGVYLAYRIRVATQRTPERRR